MKLWIYGIVVALVALFHNGKSAINENLKRTLSKGVAIKLANKINHLKIASNSNKVYSVTVQGHYIWKKVWYNETHDNGFSVNTYYKTESADYSELEKTLIRKLIYKNHPINANGLLKFISCNVNDTKGMGVNNIYNNLVKSKRSFKHKEKYPLFLTVPSEILPNIITKIVVWVNDAPHYNLITETHGADPDINYENGGHYVYLEAVWQTKKKGAVTYIQFLEDYRTCSTDDNNGKIVSAIGGPFKCLQLLRTNDTNKAITKVGLLRSNEWPLTKKKHGWDDCTADINYSRNGTHLLLCWNYYML